MMTIEGHATRDRVKDSQNVEDDDAEQDSEKVLVTVTGQQLSQSFGVLFVSGNFEIKSFLPIRGQETTERKGVRDEGNQVALTLPGEGSSGRQ